MLWRPTGVAAAFVQVVQIVIVVGRALDVGWGRSEAAETAPCARSTTLHARESPSTILQLQRLAGNRATVAMRTPPRRTVMRCAGGACHCGGACRRKDVDDELLVEGRERMRRAVAARSLARAADRAVPSSPAASRSRARRGGPLLPAATASAPTRADLEPLSAVGDEGPRAAG